MVAIQAKAETYDGTASGKAASTSHRPGNGSRTRVVAHAVAVPSATEPAITAIVRPIVVRARSRVRSRSSQRSIAAVPPAATRTTR